MAFSWQEKMTDQDVKEKKNEKKFSWQEKFTPEYGEYKRRLKEESKPMSEIIDDLNKTFKFNEYISKSKLAPDTITSAESTIDTQTPIPSPTDINERIARSFVPKIETPGNQMPVRPPTSLYKDLYGQKTAEEVGFNTNMSPTRYPTASDILTSVYQNAYKPLEQPIVPQQEESRKPWGEVLGESILGHVAQADVGITNIPRLSYKIQKEIADIPVLGNILRTVIPGLNIVKGISDVSNRLKGYDIVEKGLDDLVNYYENQANERIGRAMEGATPIQQFIGEGLGATVEMVPTMATALMTGGGSAAATPIANVSKSIIPGLTKGGIQTFFSQLRDMIPFMSQAAGQYAREAENEGAPIEEQALYGMYGGLAEGITEMIPFGHLKRIVGLTDDAAKQAIKRGAKEALKRYGKKGLDWLMNAGINVAEEIAVNPIIKAGEFGILGKDVPLTGDEGFFSAKQTVESAKGALGMSLVMTALGLPASTIAHKLARAHIEDGTVPTPEEQEQLKTAIQQEIGKTPVKQAPDIEDIAEHELQEEITTPKPDESKKIADELRIKTNIPPKTLEREQKVETIPEFKAGDMIELKGVGTVEVLKTDKDGSVRIKKKDGTTISYGPTTFKRLYQGPAKVVEPEKPVEDKPVSLPEKAETKEEKYKPFIEEGFTKSQYQSGYVKHVDNGSVRVFIDDRGKINANFMFKYKTSFGENSSGYQETFDTPKEAIERINEFFSKLAERKGEKETAQVEKSEEKKSTEAAIERFAKNVLDDRLKKSGQTLDDASYQNEIERYKVLGQQLVDAINNKDFETLTERLHRGNPYSLKLFTEITGLSTKTQKETDANIRSLDPDAYDKWINEKQAKIDEKREEEERKELEKALSVKVRHNGKVMTKKEFIDSIIAEGYTEISRDKRGVIPVIWLKKGNVGYEFTNKDERTYIEKIFDERRKAEEKKEQEEYDALPQHIKDEIDSFFKKGDLESSESKQQNESEEIEKAEEEYPAGTKIKSKTKGHIYIVKGWKDGKAILTPESGSWEVEIDVDGLKNRYDIVKEEPDTVEQESAKVKEHEKSEIAIGMRVKYTTKDGKEMTGIVESTYEYPGIGKVATVEHKPEPNKHAANVGYHAGDLGKSEHFGRFYGSARDTGHFGTGTYFVGNKEKLNLSGYKDRPTHEVDLTGYNLYKPENAKDAELLHDMLKYANNYFEYRNMKNLSYDELRSLSGDPDEAHAVLTEYNLFDEDEFKEATGYTFQEIKEGQIWNRDIADAFEKQLRQLENLNRTIGYAKDYKEKFDENVQRMFGIPPEKADSILQGIYDDINTKMKGKDFYSMGDMRMADSVSTRFMKALGYEGVDVRHIPSFDNTMYGTVVYDLRQVERKEKGGIIDIGEGEGDVTGNRFEAETVKQLRESNIKKPSGEQTEYVQETEGERRTSAVRTGEGESGEGNVSDEGEKSSGRVSGKTESDISGETTKEHLDTSYSLGRDDEGNTASRRARASGINFRITEDVAIGEGGQKTKYKNNVAAIRLLKQLEAEGRLATYDEQKILAKYVGWGGIPQAFNPKDEKWAAEYKELKELLSKEEYDAAHDSMLNAHYTSPEVIKSMYEAVMRLGFDGGRILEPAMGVGNFFGLIPDSINAKLTGVELDKITGGIAKQLYQDANIHIKGYEETNFPDDYFDLIISNVPFGDYKVNDPKYNKYNFLIHDYFFAKSLDKVREGGIIAFITSKGTMDKKDKKVREYISERAELIGAIRLPNTAFAKNAGTQVTTDIIFLRKLSEGEKGNGESWTEVKQTKDGVPVNEYYIKHPEMMLGTMVWDKSMYGGDEETALHSDGRDLKKALKEAIKNLPEGVYKKKSGRSVEDISFEDYVLGPNEREGSIVVRNGMAFQIQDGKFIPMLTNADNPNKPSEPWPKTKVERIEGMIAIRNALKNVFRTQIENRSEEEIIKAREELNRLYDNFIKKFSNDKKKGYINSYANKIAFCMDPDYPLLTTLEVFNPETETYEKADVFTKRVIIPSKIVEKAETASDALAVSLNETGKINLKRMAELTGKTESELINDLKGVIYKNPASGMYETVDEYLSGNVREKLRIAQAAAKEDSSYNENVDALKRVQPEDIKAKDIQVRLGANWIGKETVRDFANVIFQTDAITVEYIEGIGEWTVQGKSSVSDTILFSTWGTNEMSGLHILENLLNMRQINVTIWEGEGEDRHINKSKSKKATIAARQKADAIQRTFRDWIYKDTDRRQKLETVYNEMFNSERLRKYDGSFLTFEGLTPAFKPRDYQKDAIARILFGGNTLLAHAVGAGKTAEMIIAGHELKRMGLSNKPMYVVPNHLIEQWHKSFLQLYPSANVLVATKKDFSKKNRARFISRIATGEWDAVVISHSSFGKIGVSTETERAFIQEELDDLEEALRAAKAEKNKNIEKELSKARKRLLQKLEELNQREDKDDYLTFEELGVDYMFVDEAHNFKNLFFYTKMGRIAGVTNSKAKRASDMYMKTRYVTGLHNGKAGLVFATGTPISNSMTEMFTMQRYLQMPTLEMLRLKHFDSWAATFGEVKNVTEVDKTGKGFKTKQRFAKFFNAPELVRMFRKFADIITSEDLGTQIERPEIEGGKPIIVSVEPSDELKAYIDTLIERADAIAKGLVDKSEDNNLKVTNDGRLAALDLRLIDPSMPDNPNSKLNRAVDNIYKEWKDGKDKKLTQFVFSDLGTPKDKDRKQTGDLDEAQGWEVGSWYKDSESGMLYIVKSIKREKVGSPAIVERVYEDGRVIKKAENFENEHDKPSEAPDEFDYEEYGIKEREEDDTPKFEIKFDIYNDIKQKLIKYGIPENEIAFIHDAKTDEAKEKLFEKVRRGEVRILMGSTAKMGEGMNAQTRAIALHHLDAPWKPSSVEQRNGRIIRHGNINKKVRIYHYVTKGSFDAYIWQLIENKAKFITQIMSGNLTSREIEDVFDPVVLNAAAAKAAASDDPRMLELFDINTRFNELELAKQSYQSKQYEMGDELERLPKRVARLKEELDLIKKDMGRIENVKGDNFKITFSKDSLKLVPTSKAKKIKATDGIITDRKEAGEIILDIIANLPRYDEYAEIGSFAGFNLSVKKIQNERIKDHKKEFVDEVTLRLTGAREYTVIASESDTGNIMKLENILTNNMPKELSRIEEEIKRVLKEITLLEEEIKKPFPEEEEYNKLAQRKSQLESELNLDKSDHSEDDIVDEEEDSEGALAQRKSGDKSSYYIQTRDEDFKKVDGKKVIIPGCDYVEAFYHKAKTGEFIVSEAKTGVKIAAGNTLGNALLSARTTLEKSIGGKDDFKSVLVNHIKKSGVSPRYTLDEVEAELGERIREALEPEEGTEFLGAGWVPPWQRKGRGAGTGSSVKHSDYTGFSDEEMEDRWQRAKNEAGPNMKKTVSRLQEIKETVHNQLFRGAFEHLPRTKEYAELRFKLLNFLKGKDIALYKTLKNIQGIVINMTPKQYDLFSRKVALADMIEEAKAGHALAFGFKNMDQVEHELERVNREIENDPEISEALALRNKLWDAIKKQYIEVMKAIGFNVEDRFNRKNYYRHLILDYINRDRVLTGTGKRLKTPTNAGYLKRRYGSELDYVSDYIQAESEVMAQMLFDMERAKVINYVEKSHHNIIKKLKAKARDLNNSAVNDIIEKELLDPKAPKDKDGNPISITQKRMQKFAQMLAMSFDRLQTMADNGTLWIGENNEYEEIAMSLSRDSDIDIEDDSNKLFKYLAVLAKTNEAGAIEAATILKYTAHRKMFVKELLGDRYATWEKVIPEGYSIWQAQPGNSLYMTYSLPEGIAEKLLTDQLEQIGITREMLQRVVALGMPHRQMVLPDDVVATLNNLYVERNDAGLEKFAKFLSSKWKVWQLISPSRVIKYNIRNLSGDADHMFAGNPHAFLKVPQAMKELFDTMYMDKPMSKNLKDWFERGGFQTLLQVQELGDINRLKMFLHLQEKKGKPLQLPLKAWQAYWKAARISTDFREAILRYAAYLDYLEQLEKGDGKPKNFGASIPEEVMGLTDNKDKAFKLANELLGAYDDVSVMGQYIRKRWIPFYSWIEINATFYKRIFQNSLRNDEFMATLGRVAAGAGKKASFFMLRNIGRVVFGTLFLSGLLQAINAIFFSDEEAELPASVRARPHIILGRDENGNIRYFSRLGALTDLLEWVGLDTPIQDVKDILNGRMTIKDKIKDMLLAPINKIAGSAIPIEKMGIEALVRRSIYPDVSNPKTIRDRAEYIANSLGLLEEYKTIAGKPQKSNYLSLDTLSRKIIYKADPNESAYYEILDVKRKFLAKHGKIDEGFYLSPRSNALYNYKLALRYKDADAAARYLAEYKALGGTKEGLKRSLETMKISYGIPQELREEFLDSLTPAEMVKFEMARQFYLEVLAKNTEFQNTEEFEEESEND